MHWSARLDSARMRHSVDLGERAEALIAIADPQFQGELEDFAVRSHYLEHTATAAVVYA
jgi:acyl-CoA hydrolase